MATTTVPSTSFPAQPPLVNKREIGEVTPESTAIAAVRSLHVGIVQEPVRKWEKPWRHQRAIVLFAASPQETKLRIYAEGRIKAGEHVLQVIRVGAK